MARYDFIVDDLGRYALVVENPETGRLVVGPHAIHPQDVAAEAENLRLEHPTAEIVVESHPGGEPRDPADPDKPYPKPHPRRAKV